MTDSNDKNQPLLPKILSNSLRLKSPHNVKSRQNVSNILNRLPFLRKLNETQNQLLSVTPVWQQWCADQASAVITKFASLASLDDGVLTISCKQSSTATILKHKQSSLLETIEKAGFSHVHSIRIQMSLEQSASEPNDGTEDSLKDIDTQPKSTSLSEAAWRKPSASSLKSIEATQSLIKNEQLAASLKRLAETLKKAT